MTVHYWLIITAWAVLVLAPAGLVAVLFRVSKRRQRNRIRRFLRMWISR